MLFPFPPATIDPISAEPAAPDTLGPPRIGLDKIGFIGLFSNENVSLVCPKLPEASGPRSFDSANGWLSLACRGIPNDTDARRSSSNNFIDISGEIDFRSILSTSSRNMDTISDAAWAFNIFGGSDVGGRPLV